MKWQTKLIKNSLFGILPFPQTIRRIKRKIRPPCIPINEWTLEEGIRQVEILRSAGFTIAGRTVLELGTGWQPIIPLIFYLTGARKLILIDIQRLLDADLVLSTIAKLKHFDEKISKRLGIPISEVKNRLVSVNCASLDEILDHFNMKYMAPHDIRGSSLSGKSVDIIISHEVFEHITPQAVFEILIEFRRILKDDGAMCHIIDNSDHWEHGDKSISRLNFLKFGDLTWKFTSINPLDYQNRLRHFEYIDLIRQSGFQINYTRSEADEKSVNDLKQMRICRKYRHISREDLAALTSYIVASKKALQEAE